METEKKKLSKGTKILLIVLAIYFIVMLIIFLPGYIKLKHDKLYIVTNSYNIKYENGKWATMDITDTRNDYETYIEGKYQGKYTIYYSDRMFVYNNGKRINKIGGIFAYRGTIKLKFNDSDSINTMSTEDRVVVDKALEKINVNTTYSNVFFQKKYVDIDNDGVDEAIYYVTNNSDEESTQLFSILFIEDDGEIYIINSDTTSPESRMGIQIYGVGRIVDIYDDKEPEMIYTSGYPMGDEDDCLIIYNLSKKKVIKNFCDEK